MIMIMMTYNCIFSFWDFWTHLLCEFLILSNVHMSYISYHPWFKYFRVSAEHKPTSVQIIFHFNTTADTNTFSYKENNKFILNLLLFIFWLNKQICPSQSSIQKIEIEFNVDTTFVTEFKQNPFFFFFYLVDVIQGVHTPQKGLVSLTIWNENYDRK